MTGPRILTADWDKPESWSLATYKASGGWQALPKALKMQPQQIVDEVVKSNLRGRGGAGFPTGMKWNFVRKETSFPKYLVVNADEGEPGTFKDRWYLERDPHRFIEGALVAAWAVGIDEIYIYLRDEYHGCRAILEKEIAALQASLALGLLAALVLAGLQLAPLLDGHALAPSPERPRSALGWVGPALSIACGVAPALLLRMLRL